jgi:hypothetical protein
MFGFFCLCEEREQIIFSEILPHEKDQKQIVNSKIWKLDFS